MIDSSYDVCLFNQGAHEKMIDRLKAFGFSGAYFLINFTNKNDFEKSLKEFKDSKTKSFDCKLSILIETDKQGNIQKICQQAKERVDMIAVRGLNEDVFRKASETKGVDMITGFIDRDNGLLIDYVTMNFCRQNNVAVNFGFSELLQRENVSRVHFVKELFEAAKIARKRKAPVIFSSLAANEWELRKRSDIDSFARIAGRL